MPHRGRRVGPGRHAPARPVVLALVVAAAAALALWTTPWSRARPEPGPGSTTVGALPCTGVRIPSCRQLVEPGRPPVRYAVLRPQGPEQDSRAVVVDLGGPGLSLFGVHWPGDSLRDLLPAPLRGRALILLEEPWVTAQAPAACDRATGALFQLAHAGGRSDAAGTAVADGCALFAQNPAWGWSPDTYQEAVQGVLRTEQLRLDGFVGLSFGARRLTYLRDVQPAWAVLVDPAPRSVGNVGYLRGREQAALSALAARSTHDPAKAFVRQTAALGRSSLEVPGRSTPLTSADLAAALLAMSYQSDLELPQAVTAMTSLPAVGARVKVASLADSVWTRYGDNQISPAYLAYLSEVCPAYAPWGAPGRDDDPVAAFLAAWHSPCQAVPQRQVQTYAPGLSRSSTCVASLAADPVTPVGAAQSWRAVARTILTPTAGREHGRWQGVADCLTALGVSTGSGSGAS